MGEKSKKNNNLVRYNILLKRDNPSDNELIEYLEENDLDVAWIRRLIRDYKNGKYISVDEIEKLKKLGMLGVFQSNQPVITNTIETHNNKEKAYNEKNSYIDEEIDEDDDFEDIGGGLI